MLYDCFSDLRQHLVTNVRAGQDLGSVEYVQLAAACQLRSREILLP